MENRVGDIYTTNEGYEIEIIKYYSAINCTILFTNGLILYNRTYDDIKKGCIKNPYHPKVYNVGHIGVGDYVSKINNKVTKVYKTWAGVLERCHSDKLHLKRSSYIGCSVHSEWYNFQNFAEWFEENHIEGFDLDKDILVKGNKIYSPKTCCFVPKEINSLFVKCDKSRGDLPIGVSLSRHNKFVAKLSSVRKQIHLGTFNTSEEAFQAYKIAKESYIKELAEKYKHQITEACYQALYSYQVELND